MINALAWLKEHRSVNVLLLVAYIFFILFAHGAFVALSVVVMNAFSLPVYNRLVALLVALAPMVVGALVYRALKRKMKSDPRGLFFLVLVVCGLVVHFFVFTEMNIEFIHAMEFGVLAALIYPLVGRFGAAIVWALPVMLADEWYQYKVLFDYVEYFDFNDILLDLLGAGLFLSLLRVLGVGTEEQATPLLKHLELYVLGIFVLLTTVLLATNFVVCHPTDATNDTWLILNDITVEYGFWRVHPLIGSTYHVLEPVAGMITVFGVCAAYLFMDPMRSEK